MAAVDVNDAPGEGCKCTKDQMPTVCFTMNVAACILIGLVAVLDLITFTGIPAVILDLYLVVLAFFALSAEARMFKPLRSMIYAYMKFVYFLTSYTGRGLFYFFLGSVTINESALSYIGGGYAMFAGLFLIIANCKFKMPIYMDWQVVKEEAAAKGRAIKEEAFRSGTTPGSTPSGGSAPGSSAGGGYVPPGHSI